MNKAFQVDEQYPGAAISKSSDGSISPRTLDVLYSIAPGFAAGARFSVLLVGALLALLLSDRVSRGVAETFCHEGSEARAICIPTGDGLPARAARLCGGFFRRSHRHAPALHGALLSNDPNDDAMGDDPDDDDDDRWDDPIAIEDEGGPLMVRLQPMVSYLAASLSVPLAWCPLSASPFLSLCRLRC
jgi:hypothetical protein